MKHRLFPLIPLLILLLLLGASVRPAGAHANLLQSVPEANATLDRPPVQIELFFSEPIDPSFSTIEVLDGNGRRVDNEDASLDATDPTRLTASLRSMPDGVYTVSWRALSSVDSHITAGAFPFAVGDVDMAALDAAAQASTQFNLSAGEVIARWLTFISAMVLVGGALFILLVWQPACKIAGVGQALDPPWRRLAYLSLIVLIVANLFWLLLQAGQAAGAGIVLPWDPAVSQVLTTTRFGALWLARFVLAVLLIWLVSKPQTQRRRWLIFAAGILLLLTISLGSHAAAQPKPFLPILSDWVHLIVASVWVGGLVHFVAGLFTIRELEGPDRARLTAVLIPRFSATALVSVSLLVLTGLYASILQVGSLDALSTTAYGRTLLFKLAFVLPMLLLGALNLLGTTPRMKGAAAGQNGQLVSSFRHIVTGEVTLGMAVLLAVAILTTLPPARVPVSTPMLTESQEVDGLEIALEVTPGRPGLNTFLVTVTQEGQPLLAVRELSLQFTPATVDLPPSNAQLSDQGDGQFVVDGGFLALPDTWQVQVAVRRLDAFDTFANFDLNVGAATAGRAFPWYRVSGALLLATGIIYMLALTRLITGRTKSVALGGLPAVTLALIGLLILFRPPVEDVTALVNPIPPNADSLAAGEVLYVENCLPCHGPAGAGDGPVGLTLNPPPADLTVHTLPGVHPDGRLYDWITNGFPESVMPAFNVQLSDEERWHLVNYIRTLSQP